MGTYFSAACFEVACKDLKCLVGDFGRSERHVGGEELDDWKLCWCVE